MTTDRRDFDSLLAEFGDYSAFGIDETTLDDSEKAILARQTGFLACYAEVGNIYRAAPVSGVGRSTVHQWQHDDVLGFRARFEAAQHTHREYLEDIMFSRILAPEGNRGSDILVIFAVKAAWPDKYRDVVVLGDDTAKDVLKALQSKRTKRTTEDTEPESKAPTPIEAMRDKARDGA